MKRLSLHCGDNSEEEGTRMILHAYPGRAFTNSDFGDFIPYVGVYRFAKTLSEWKEELSRIIKQVELKKGDYNIPHQLLHPHRSYLPLSDLVGELDVIEVEARETDKAMREILEKIGV